ncbi:phage portal protein [Hoeflea sp. WL0058]|uniref:Phage portal protein n=1 Tax=Flavimaribacter sediminis TaxID=2865987 RepID=A0AAE2ZQN7_9HYPH|nr:phage portal protein [Flavimaribacter sediminis]MBW8638985.1 phage portal protein [Flavimaribacter sediminis]
MANWLQKALSTMRHSGGATPFMFGFLKRTRFNYAREVGDGLDSSVIMAPVQWVQRAFPEARLRVVSVKGDGAREEIDGHDMTALIRRPNPYYGDVHLWAATLLSYLIDGNAYWLKVRNGVGKPVELWWVPSWAIEPKWPQDGSEFISYYEYSPGGGAKTPLEFDDVVHFRHGVNPRNQRKGLSPLSGVIREIFMDLEASNFAASLLKNMGVPGVVISPDGSAQPSPEDVASVKAWFKQAFSGDNRGEPLVMGGATKVEQYGFNPQQMDMSTTRDVAEERVCAVLGVPAAVVGFGAGLQTAKVGATMTELRKLAWTNGVLPITSVFADELNRSLLPDFSKGRTAEEVEYDVSDVQALQDDLDKLFSRMDTAVRGGWAMVYEAREAAGLDVDDSHRIYLRPFSAIEVPAGAPPRVEPADPEKSGTKARRRPSAAQRGYVRALSRMEAGLQTAAEKRLKSFFADLGKEASRAAQPILSEEDLGQASAATGERKEDELLVYRILDALDTNARQAALRQVFEAHYLEVAKEVAKAGELVGIATGLPDPVGRAVAQAGGRRAGLVDLEKQSRRALFDAIAEGRAEGEGVLQLAERIAEHVEAGPWTSVEQRSITIARTETKFAQNVSTIEITKNAGADRLTVFDGRFGRPRSDPDHIARDGIVVTADEAAAMAADEHPNGTLSFAPYFDIQEDE